MACGATLKRTMDFDPLMNPTSPKRRRCVPVSTSSSSPRKYLSMEPSPFGESSSRLSAEQILNSIKQEYKRIQKRKHLDGGYQQPECCYSPESPSQSSTMNVPSMPGTSSGGVSPTRKEQPLFTLRQVGMICERLLKEREEKVREEYEETMTSKLAGWYNDSLSSEHTHTKRTETQATHTRYPNSSVEDGRVVEVLPRDRSGPVPSHKSSSSNGPMQRRFIENQKSLNPPTGLNENN